jgi:3-oxoacyl-[acyl-carrier protein] reductase
MKSDEKTAPVYLITGTSSGIGRELAYHYLSVGVTVVGVSRSVSTIDDNNYYHFESDISNSEQLQIFFSKLKKKFQSIDVLINNAGCLTSMNSLIIPIKSVRNMVETNIIGTFLVTREVAKIMSINKFGRIINISSMAEILEPSGDAVYSATKCAVTTLSNSLAKEYARYNITCNTLAITYFPTKLSAKINKKSIEEIISKLPLARVAKLTDITNAIDFFVCKNSSYITGQFLALGGIHR